MLRAVIVGVCVMISSFTVAEDFRIVVSGAPGSNGDTLARATARHLGRHLSGNPNVIVQNMPGAGGLVAANWVYAVAPKDGATIGIIQPDTIRSWIVGSEGVKFGHDMSWLGSVEDRASGVQLLWIRPNTPTPVIGALSTAGTPLAALVARALYPDPKVVAGYKDNREVVLAIERGELDGMMLSLDGAQGIAPGWLESGAPVRPVAQFGTDERHPSYPGVPLASEIIKNDRLRAELDRLEVATLMGKPFVAPSGLPETVIAALAESLQKLCSDPAFQADMRASGLRPGHTSRSKTLEYVKRIE